MPQKRQVLLAVHTLHHHSGAGGLADLADGVQDGQAVESLREELQHAAVQFHHIRTQVRHELQGYFSTADTVQGDAEPEVAQGVHTGRQPLAQ